MKQSFQAFLRGIIDYAGLFPPAKLPLDEAIHNYAGYRKGDDSWMLSRFIVPARQLQDLSVYGDDLFAKGDPFAFSVLGKGTATAEEFKEEIGAIIQHCRQFNEHHRDRVTTDVLEIKLPKEAVLGEDPRLVEDLLSETAAMVRGSTESSGLEYLFCECVLSESWHKELETVIEAISNHNKLIAGDTDTYRYAGFKLRCGGVEASMFPTPEQVAFALNRARQYGVAVKCTAGLHHPVRHYNKSVQTKMHGFFNVFGGAMLAYAHDLTDEEFTEILREEDPEQFSFSDEAFSWGELSVSTTEIEELRETTLISYGSCSFDEPREDLHKLQLL